METDIYNTLNNLNRLSSLEICVRELERQVKLLNDLIQLQIKINDANVDTLKTISK